MPSFDPPGFLQDFNQQQQEAWSDWMSQQLDDAKAGQPDVYDFDAPRPRFFNVTKTPLAADAVEKDISWTAFPRLVAIDAATDEERWKTADGSRDVQDEYCEWSVTRLADGRISRVTFTCEGPEYWQFLAATDPAKVLDLYRGHIDPAVQPNDLLTSAGTYNPRNKWNSGTSKGAMHLIQQNNTLGAEIELAAGASNTRAPKGVLLTNDQDLIRCGAYGQAERHSDPTIGGGVNLLARTDANISLANPVGIYFAGLNTAGWASPDGTQPALFWKITRGTAEKAVRAVFEVPADRGYLVSDVTINGKPIKFGGQISDFISMKLTGVAMNIGKCAHPPIAGCKSRAAKTAGLTKIDVASTLRRPATPARY
ncbi:hypothetical protein GUK34_09860 [Rhizobium leguminosarum]|uniref:hypothetical protein n=1 Tax=Rhizobium ruizarguesonis TaxID=2081791 RepID=UPI00103F7288|nr:hypothetical protein [Rhizobium ruizarguesonis]NEI05191.1 hypothetical protein [Rhizobium ruizarguesonis]TCA16111.1 hypothetical protein E0H70_35185 [Rhizobium leguminosarum bv. viciae]